MPRRLLHQLLFWPFRGQIRSNRTELLIPGASAGIGRATTGTFTARGAKIALLAFDRAPRQVAAAFSELGALYSHVPFPQDSPTGSIAVP